MFCLNILKDCLFFRVLGSFFYKIAGHHKKVLSLRQKFFCDEDMFIDCLALWYINEAGIRLKIVINFVEHKLSKSFWVDFNWIYPQCHSIIKNIIIWRIFNILLLEGCTFGLKVKDIMDWRRPLFTRLEKLQRKYFVQFKIEGNLRLT